MELYMKKLNLFSPINSLGYGVVGLNLLKVLSQKLDVALSLIGAPNTPETNVQIVQESINKFHLLPRKYN